MSLTKRWSEAGYLSHVVLTHALRQVSVSLIFDVRQNRMKAWHLVTAALAVAALLSATHITVRTNYGYVSTATGSRRTYTEWEIPTTRRTNEVYIKSPIEAYLERKGIRYADQWISYEGTGRSILGAVTYRGHGNPGPVLEIRPEFFPVIETMTDEEKMEIFDCLSRKDEKQARELALRIFEKSINEN
jgi:hypothetical protein